MKIRDGSQCQLLTSPLLGHVSLLPSEAKRAVSVLTRTNCPGESASELPRQLRPLERSDGRLDRRPDCAPGERTSGSAAWLMKWPNVVPVDQVNSCGTK